MPTSEHEKGLVLIVEDDSATLGLLVQQLGRAGFETAVARDGRSGLQRAEQVLPDAILLDVMMPQMDGFETCQELKRNPRTQAIPVVFMTALSSLESKMRGFDAGAVDYVTKPFQFAEVEARLRTHCLLSRLQRRLGEQNQDLRREVSEREKLIGELDAFAHTVAHDVKAPLANVQMTMELLSADLLPQLSEEQIQLLTVGQRSAQRALVIVDELLLLASLRHEEVQPEALAMGAIVERALERLGNEFSSTHAELILPSFWEPAQGRAGWVEEVWYNLLSNACKYGGRPPRLELGSAPAAGGLVRFWVQDNGRGLSPEEQGKLFAPFVRLDRVRAQGHGLGLSVARRIVERLTGRLGVESQVGCGSRFYFELPGGEAP